MVTCARAGEGKDKETLCLEVQRILNAEGRVTLFADNKPGYYWYKGFMEWHKDEVRERKAMSLGEQRAQVTEQKIRGWFHHLRTSLHDDGIDITKVPPSNVFNCDETGFPFYLGSSVIIADMKSKHPYQVGSDTKTQVTVLSCCSADGKVLKPTIIFPGARVQAAVVDQQKDRKDPEGKPTQSAHPARFSPEDKFSRHRIILKKRFGLLLTQQPKQVM